MKAKLHKLLKIWWFLSWFCVKPGRCTDADGAKEWGWRESWREICNDEQFIFLPTFDKKIQPTGLNGLNMQHTACGEKASIQIPVWKDQQNEDIWYVDKKVILS